jgi:TolA-binding protein
MILTVVAMLVFISMVGATPKVSNKIFPSWANIKRKAEKRKAESCLKSGDYSQARQIYTTILAQWPQTRLALEAQKNLVILDIITGSEKVPLVLGKFLADYSDYRPINNAFGDIVIHYVKQKEIDNIVDLYQHFLSKYPSDPQIMWAQSGLAICYIILQNKDMKAEAAVEKLLADFSDHPEIANAVTGIANWYLRRRKIDNAIKLYQYISSKYPSDPQATWAQSGLARCYILQNEDVKAEAAIEKLLVDYTNHPYIAKGINAIANKYRNKKTDRAIELYQHILSKYPTSYWAMWAQSGLAKCYILQNEDTKAKAAVEKLFQNCTDHPDIDKCVKTIGQFRFMGKTNIINQKYVLDNWISADKPLQIQKIGLLFCIEYFDNKTACDALEKFMAGLAKYPDSTDIINEIADHCHELKKHEMAVKLYQVYLNHYALESNKKEIELRLYKSMYLAGMELEKVLVSLGKYIDRHKKTNTSLAAEALVLRGQIFAKLGEVDKAINEFLMLKNEYPEIKESPEASFFVGYCYMLQRKFDQAKEALNLVVKDYPQSSFASKAKLYLNRIEEMDE